MFSHNEELTQYGSSLNSKAIDAAVWKTTTDYGMSPFLMTNEFLQFKTLLRLGIQGGFLIV